MFAHTVAGVGALRGDVSLDGQVSAMDAQGILTGVAGLPLPSGWIANPNGDAKSNTYCYCDSYAYTDSYAYGNSNSYSHAHGDALSDANGDCCWLQLVSRSGHAYPLSESGWRLLSYRR